MISCHDADNFKDPDEYQPERWLMDDTKTNSRCTEAGANLVVPFGVGRRQCPGRRFVEMELTLITAKVSFFIVARCRVPLHEACHRMRRGSLILICCFFCSICVSPTRV